MASRPTSPVEVFYSYSHKDEKLRDKLDNHLTLLQRQGLISEWHDRMIEAGDEWESEINAHLNSAQIILLLVSDDFIASDYCYSIEMERALERHEDGEARVIPIILRPVDWETSPLGKLQALPKDGKAVTLWKNRDTAFKNVAQGIRKVIREFKPKAKHPSTSTFIPRSPVVGFVARLDEQGQDIVGRLKEELAPQGNQLITLSGPGGIGKTTLAAEAARALKEVFGERLVWSSAEKRTDFTLSTLLDDIATQLGREDLRTLAPALKEVQVRELITDSPTIIVLDNYETMAADAKQGIGEWFALAQCSALLTSRHGISWTRNIQIAAMSHEEAQEYLEKLITQTQDSQIFSAEVRQRIYETAEANPYVMQWVVAQIGAAQEPRTVLDELAQGEGDAAARVFDRSFNLEQVGDDGRAALLALSLFVPSATRDALAEVAGFDGDVKRVNEAVRNLRELWLIKGLDENRRFTLEGLTRSLTRARLSKDDRANEFRRRFVTHFLSYVKAHAQPTPEDFDALEAEKDNLLSAIDVAFAVEDLSSGMNIASILAKPVSGMLSIRGYWEEAIRIGEQSAIAAQTARDEGAVARFAINAATIRMYRGEYDGAGRTYQQAIAAFRKLGSEEHNVAVGLHLLGMLAQDQGDVEEARRLYNESLEINTKLDEQKGIAGTLHQLAMLARDKGEVEEARRLYNESLEINTKLGEQKGIAHTLHELGLLAQDQGEIEAARRLYNESLEIDKRLGNQGGIASGLHNLGRLEEIENNKEEAARLFREALGIFERLKSPDAKIARQSLERVESGRS